MCEIIKFKTTKQENGVEELMRKFVDSSSRQDSNTIIFINSKDTSIDKILEESNRIGAMFYKTIHSTKILTYNTVEDIVEMIEKAKHKNLQVFIYNAKGLEIDKIKKVILKYMIDLYYNINEPILKEYLIVRVSEKYVGIQKMEFETKREAVQYVNDKNKKSKNKINYYLKDLDTLDKPKNIKLIK